MSAPTYGGTIFYLALGQPATALPHRIDAEVHRLTQWALRVYTVYSLSTITHCRNCRGQFHEQFEANFLAQYRWWGSTVVVANRYGCDHLRPFPADWNIRRRSGWRCGRPRCRPGFQEFRIPKASRGGDSGEKARGVSPLVDTMGADAGR